MKGSCTVGVAMFPVVSLCLLPTGFAHALVQFAVDLAEHSCTLAEACRCGSCVSVTPASALLFEGICQAPCQFDHENVQLKVSLIMVFMTAMHLPVSPEQLKQQS